MINIDHIYCINLDSRPDRWAKMKEQFDRLGLEVERFPALTGDHSDPNPKGKTLGQIGCLKSHCAVVKDALAKGYEQVMIFEDDVVLCDDFKKRLEFCTRELPASWASLYLGGTIFNNPPVQVSRFVYKNRRTFGTFSFILRRSIFRELIDIYSAHIYNADDCHADHMQKRFDSYIIIPFLTHVGYDTSDVITGEALNESLYSRIYNYYKNEEEFKNAYTE